MTELEQLRADLATIQEAAEIAKIRGFHELAGNYDQVEGELKQKIAKLEAQEQVDPWERARGYVDYALKHYLPSNGREIALYARHLEAKVAQLEAQQAQSGELTGSKLAKETDSFKGMTGNGVMWKYVRHLEVKVAELDNELRCERIDGGKVRDDQKAFTAEKNREKLAELTTIVNAIPPACGLAQELVEQRIEGVKKEMQNNGN